MTVNFTNASTYSVSSTIEISHSYHFVKNVFDANVPNLAKLYEPWGRCLAIVDNYVFEIYGDHMKAYFKAHKVAATIQPVNTTEDSKNVDSLVEICGWITEFNKIRREPVLVIGGGLVTDVVG